MSPLNVACNRAIHISISRVENETPIIPQPEYSAHILGRKVRQHKRSALETVPIEPPNIAIDAETRIRAVSARGLDTTERPLTSQSKEDRLKEGNSSNLSQQSTLRIQNSYSQKLPGEKKYHRSISTTLDIETLIRTNKIEALFTLISSGAFSDEENSPKVAISHQKIKMIFDTFQADGREADLIEFVVSSFQHDLPKDHEKPPLRSNEPSLLFFKEFCIRYIPGLFDKGGLISTFIKKLKKQRKSREWKQLDDFLADRPIKSGSRFDPLSNKAHEFTLEIFQSICTFSLQKAHPACKTLWRKLDHLFYQFYLMRDEASDEMSENDPQQQARALLGSVFFFRLICGELYPITQNDKSPALLSALASMLMKGFTHIACGTKPQQNNLRYIDSLLEVATPLLNSFLDEMTSDEKLLINKLLSEMDFWDF